MSKRRNIRCRCRKLRRFRFHCRGCYGHRIILRNMYVDVPVNYQFKRILGEGSYSVCCKVRNLKTRKTYTAKIFSREKANLEERFQESYFLKKLDNTYILKMFDRFYYRRHEIFITEYCEGGTLDNFIAQNEVIPLERIRTFMRQLLEGLCYLHQNLILHTDIKPDNILLTASLQIKITGLRSAIISTNLNEQWSRLASSSYSAPEIWLRYEFSFQADIWAAGCCFYKMLSKKEFFEQPIPKETLIIDAWYRGTVELNSQLEQRLRELDPCVNEALLMMLKPRPDERPPAHMLLGLPFFRTDTQLQTPLKSWGTEANCNHILLRKLRKLLKLRKNGKFLMLLVLLICLFMFIVLWRTYH